MLARLSSLTPLPAAPTRLSADSLGLVRTGAGVTMLVQPTLLPRLLGADSATATRVSWVTQMLGAREVALGLGAFVALRRGGPAARTWLYAGALADSIDAVAVSAAIVRGRASRVTGTGVVLTAALAAATQVMALRELAGED